MATNQAIQILKSQKQCEETTRLLIKVANNILENPNNIKIRTLKKNNETVNSKIISVNGAVDCLKLMGFEDKGSCYTLPNHVTIDKIKHVRDLLVNIKESGNNLQQHVSVKTPEKQTPSTSSVPFQEEEDINVKRFVLPPVSYNFSNQFLRRIEHSFHNALAYDDQATQEHARSLIPVKSLEIKAQERLRAMQEKIKKDKLPDPEFTIQDALIMELLSWFKEEFFSWVNSPDCQYCKGKISFSHSSKNRHDLKYTERVEVYKCNDCQKLTNFPRYNDLNILLETRRGRCGEWANVFTLLCKTLGWDARFVLDELDHVWTEVYSVGQKRWIHCDPCENAFDTPLMYENGWNKKLSYVTAYSPEEVQDVTWRYSSNHKEVLRRRNNCTEKELIDALIILRSRRQKMFSKSRQNYLTLRLIRELAELMIERKPNDKEYQGRISGSLLWRTTRGEAQLNDSPMFIWQINDSDIRDNKLTIQYSAAANYYNYILGTGEVRKVKDWSGGVFKYSNIFRKEEKDWKMVYLARNDGSNVGTVTWKFEIHNSEKSLEKISVKLAYKLYENGSVEIKLKSDDIVVNFPKDEEIQEFSEFIGKKTLEISIILNGGKGDVAWQHAQLFRQPLQSEEFPFVITFIMS